METKRNSNNTNNCGFLPQGAVYITKLYIDISIRKVRKLQKMILLSTKVTEADKYTLYFGVFDNKQSFPFLKEPLYKNMRLKYAQNL